MKKKNKILVVAAPPDDEILGCGGTIAKYIKNGAQVKTIILARGVSSRYEKLGSHVKKLQSKLQKSSVLANRAIGVRDISFYDLPDNEFDTKSLLSLVKILEKEITKFMPDKIFTHFIHDLNIDHQYVGKATITAARPEFYNSVSEILFFEINSSTDYQVNSNGMQFQPNFFVDIANTLKDKKNALNFYKSEMKKYPHSRSVKAVINKNISIGNTFGLNACEAFQIVRKLEK
jgi:LmbE family N-acetylglucosaminyl deacetylase